MITAKDISKTYKSFSLNKLSFSFVGGLNIIKGKSGSGKTTILRMIVGLCKPDEGFIKIDDLPQTPFNGFFAYLPFDNTLDKSVSLNSGLKIAHEVGIDIDLLMAEELIGRFGFEKLSSKKLGRLSGGERKIANLIFTLSKRSSYLLLDEPFAPLDSRARKILSDLLYSISEKKCVIVVDHSSALDCQKASSVLDMDIKLQSVIQPHLELCNVMAASNPAKEKTRGRIGSLFRIAWDYSKRDFSSVITVFILMFLSLSLVSCSFYFLPSSNDRYNAFVSDNDPYSYLPIYKQDKTFFCDESAPERASADSLYILSSDANFIKRGNSPYAEKFLLVGTNKVKDDMRICCSKKAIGLINPVYENSSLAVTFDSVPCSLFNDNDIAISSPDDGLTSVESEGLALLYCSKNTFLQVFEDSFFFHIKDSGGKAIQSSKEYEVVISSPAMNDLKSYSLVFSSDKNTFEIAGQDKGKVFLFAFASVANIATTGDGSSLKAQEVLISTDVFFRIESSSSSMNRNDLLLSLNRNDAELLRGSGYSFFSRLVAYQNADAVMLIVFGTLLGSGLLSLFGLLLYLFLCEKRLSRFKAYERLSIIGLSKKDRFFAHFWKYGLAIGGAFLVCLIPVCSLPPFLNSYLYDAYLSSWISGVPFYSSLTFPLYYVKYSSLIFLGMVLVTVLLAFLSYRVSLSGIQKHDRDK